MPLIQYRRGLDRDRVCNHCGAFIARRDPEGFFNFAVYLFLFFAAIWGIPALAESYIESFLGRAVSSNASFFISVCCVVGIMNLFERVLPRIQYDAIESTLYEYERCMKCGEIHVPVSLIEERVYQCVVVENCEAVTGPSNEV